MNKNVSVPKYSYLGPGAAASRFFFIVLCAYTHEFREKENGALPRHAKTGASRTRC